MKKTIHHSSKNNHYAEHQELFHPSARPRPVPAQRTRLSGKELTEFINRELELRGEPTITSRTPLFNAIRKKTTVELRYQSFRMADPQTLIVHPYYLKQYNNRWFLFCCNGDHTNLSNYPLDRILSVKLAHVPYRETGIDFDDYFADVLGVTKREGLQAEKVLLRFPKNEYPYVATKPWHGSQISFSCLLGYCVIAKIRFFLL